jgi:hypothetical protein
MAAIIAGIGKPILRFGSGTEQTVKGHLPERMSRIERGDQ